MSLSTITQRVARLEYAAARLPFTLLEKNVVSRYFDDDAPARLGYERFLGSMDHAVGRLLSDDEIGRRGQAISHRADFIEKAATLEAKAEQRAEDADAKLADAEGEAEQRRRDASEERAQKLAAARKSELADKQKVRAEAEARARQGRAEATRVAEQKVDAAKRTERVAQTRISANHDRVAAAPKARLADAADKRRDAAATRADAERLQELAGAERTARRNGNVS